MVPWFAPAWVKMVRDHLILPSDRLVYLVAGARSQAGSRWKSPYSDSIETIAVASRPGANGWQHVHFRLQRPIKAVGLWIMADGDNSTSSFVTSLRRLRLGPYTAD